MSRFKFEGLLRALPGLAKSPPAENAALQQANQLRRERLNKVVRQQPTAALGVLTYWLRSRS